MKNMVAINQKSNILKKRYQKINIGLINDKKILLKCGKCNFCKSKYSFSKNSFFNCIFELRTNINDENIKFIDIDESQIILWKDLDFFDEIIENKHRFKSFNSKILKNLDNKCRLKFNRCFASDIIKKRLVSHENYLNNFIEYINKIQDLLDYLSHNRTCLKCWNFSTRSLKNMRSFLKSLKFYKISNSNESGNFEAFKIDGSNLDTTLFQNLRDTKLKITRDEGSRLIDQYYIDSGKIMKIKIRNIPGLIERIYEIEYNFPVSLGMIEYLAKLVKESLKKENIIINFKKFADIITYVYNRTQKLLEKEIILKKEEIASLSSYISFKVLKMEKIYPFLIDDLVEEVFQDSPFSNLYLHHRDHIQCRTWIKLEYSEQKDIISRLRFETNRNLNELYPNIKHVFKNRFFYARFNIDVAPVHYLGFSIDIRKLNKKILNIIDLIKFGSFNIDQASFLIFCLQTRKNITITGKTDSGKTTALNALDMLYPNIFRKVYVEDAIETLDQDPAFHHQLKFQISSKEEKYTIIKELLHRSPDILILGELLTQKEAEALFHCISAGLIGLQTIHASHPKKLLRRLSIHFGIDKSCLLDLDYIILFKKFINGQRKLISISELKMSIEGSIEVMPLSLYMPEKSSWTSIELEKSRIILDFIQNSKFSLSTLSNYLGLLKDAIKSNLKDGGNIKELIHDINQIYISHLNKF